MVNSTIGDILSELVYETGYWIKAWSSLSVSLEKSVHACDAARVANAADRVNVLELRGMIWAVLQRLKRGEPVPSTVTGQLYTDYIALHEKLIPVYSRPEGAVLEDVIHQEFKNPVLQVTPNRAEYLKELVSSIERLVQSAHDHPVRDAARAMLGLLDPLQATALIAARSTLEEFIKLYPESLSNIAEDSIPEGWCRKWWIVIAEDNAVQREAVVNICEKLQRKLVHGNFEIACAAFPDAAGAAAKFEELTAKGAPCSSDNREARALAVLDLGLPLNAETPQGHSREYGLELMRRAKKEFKLPVVILTTPTEFAGDHLEARKLPVDGYILKRNATIYVELYDILEQIISRPIPRKIRFLPDGDDVLLSANERWIQVHMAPKHRRLLEALNAAVDNRLTKRELAQALDPQAPPPGQRMLEITDPLRTWLDLRARLTERSAVKGFAQRLLPAARQALEDEFAQLHGLHQSLPAGVLWLDEDWWPKALEFLDTRYYPSVESALKQETKELAKLSVSIPQAMTEIRDEIRIAFAAAQEPIDPQEEIIKSISDHGDSYVLLAHEAEEEDAQNRIIPPILLVEDYALFREELAAMLTRDGYNVTAVASKQAALDWISQRAADWSGRKRRQPVILCLDHELELEKTAGLQVLQAARNQLDTVCAVFVTMFTSLTGRSDDDLRVEAERLGVRMQDYISKDLDPKALKASLLTRIYSLRYELMHHTAWSQSTRPPRITLYFAGQTAAISDLRRIHVDNPAYDKDWDFAYPTAPGAPARLTDDRLRLLLALLKGEDGQPFVSRVELARRVGVSDKQLTHEIDSLKVALLHHWYGQAGMDTKKETGKLLLPSIAGRGYAINVEKTVIYNYSEPSAQAAP